MNFFFMVITYIIGPSGQVFISQSTRSGVFGGRMVDRSKRPIIKNKKNVLIVPHQLSFNSNHYLHPHIYFRKCFNVLIVNIFLHQIMTFDFIAFVNPFSSIASLKPRYHHLWKGIAKYLSTYKYACLPSWIK